MKNKKAFSVGEMMVVLLIISVTLAASMPIISKRAKATSDIIWHPAQNNVDAFFNTGNNNGIIIGGTSFPSEKARLMLNLASGSDAGTSHLIFTKSNNFLSKIKMDTKRFEFGSGNGVTGDNGTAVGYTTSAGAYGTAVGSNADAGVSGATAVGYSAKAAEDGVTNSTAIGATSSAKASGATAIGYGAVSGLGGTALGNSSKASGTNTLALGLNSQATGNYNVAIGPNVTSNTGTNTMNIGTYRGLAEATEIGISTINIGYYSGGTQTAVNLLGVVKANGNLVDVVVGDSDIRKKNIIGEYKSGLDDILKIKTYEFTYKDDLNKMRRVGVIAQELQNILPKAVSKDSKGYLKVKKEDIFYAMVNAIKELNSKYIALEKENKELKQQIESLSKRIEKLEQAK